MYKIFSYVQQALYEKNLGPSPYFKHRIFEGGSGDALITTKSIKNSNYFTEAHFDSKNSWLFMVKQ